MPINLMRPHSFVRAEDGQDLTEYAFLAAFVVIVAAAVVLPPGRSFSARKVSTQQPTTPSKGEPSYSPREPSYAQEQELRNRRQQEQELRNLGQQEQRQQEQRQQEQRQ